MPNSYSGNKLVYSHSQDKWVEKPTTTEFDYEGIDQEAAAFMLSFFRWYPDYFADLCRDPGARYGLELPQRLMMRVFARYRETFITGCRGLTKTYCILLTKMIEGILYPGEIMLYIAPDQKQAAKLATQAYHQIEKDYPLIAAYWDLRNDRTDMFRISTKYGSEFTMYAPRGDNSSQTIAEEIGQEAPPFNIEKYENDVRGTCRLERRVNQKPDRAHIDQKHSHISNACSRQNPAYEKYRHGALKAMVTSDDPHEGYAIDIPWEVAVLFDIRSVAYVRDMKSKLTAEAWQREMCAHYTGSSDNPLITDETLAKSKKTALAEFSHCGSDNAVYIVSHDVAYADGRKNAKCADVVMKLTTYPGMTRRDKYRKQIVFVDNYAPQSTPYEQAQKVKSLWIKFCKSGGNATYMLIDAQAVGSDVVKELMKPTTDGTPPLCSIDHSFMPELEQPNALPVIYVMKSTRGGENPEGEMVEAAQREFEQGFVELLTTNVLDGVEAYKNYHNIKETNADAQIAKPYVNTALLCTQIGNLMTKPSGMTRKEVRKSTAIQRDIWSALKYAIWLALKLEAQGVTEKYETESDWSAILHGIETGTPETINTIRRRKAPASGLLAKRRIR